MQRLITFGLMIDTVLDVAAFFSDASWSVVTASMALGLVPLAAGLADFARRMTAEADEMANFLAQPIQR